MNTLNSIIEELTPTQQEFICFCVREHGNRKDMHRGLLPFLKAEDAANSLTAQLISMHNSLIEEAEFKKIRFIKTLISKIRALIPYKMYTDETSVTMNLSTRALAAEFGRRFGDKFCVSLGRDKSKLAMLEKAGKDQWKVTTSQKLIDQTTTWLAEAFR